VHNDAETIDQIAKRTETALTEADPIPVRGGSAALAA